MSELVFDEVLRLARRCGRVVIAGYGEPLTNPQCIPLLRALDAEGIDIDMATNGTRLTREVSVQLVALSHLRHINVSIDSPDPDVYREVRGGNVDHATRGLRNLMAEVDDPDRVVVSSVVMCANLATLVTFPTMLAELGVRRYYLQAVEDYNDYARQQRRLDPVEMADLLAEIEAACAQHGIDFELSRPERSRAEASGANDAAQRFYTPDAWDDRFTRQCQVPWHIPFVDKNGGVFPCCFSASANEHQVGQIGPQTLDEIWTGTPFQQFRRALVDGSSTPNICRGCTVAPLGEHVFTKWAGTVLSGRVTISDSAAPIVSIYVRNQGPHTWNSTDCVRVGTAAPRDAISPLFDPAWLSSNRPGTFIEESIPPGDVATFEFPVAAPADVVNAEFEIVADGTCWLPNTLFAITVQPSKARIRGRSLRAHSRNAPRHSSRSLNKRVP